jgi:hypothetical protein
VTAGDVPQGGPGRLTRLRGRARAAVAFARAHWMYALSAVVVAASILIWYRVSAPPYGSNTVINLYPWRQVNLASSLFAPFYWPGSYIPQAFGAPYAFLVAPLQTVSGGSLWFPQLTLLLTINVVGGLCLFRLVKGWLNRYGIAPVYALISVVIYSFNPFYVTNGYGTYAGVFAEGPFGPGDPAFLIILVFLTYLALFRSLKFVALLGVASFFAWCIFPSTTEIAVLEYLAAFAVLLYYRFEQTRLAGMPRRFRNLGVRGAVILGTLVVANLYLLYPAVTTFSAYYNAAGTSSPSYPYDYGSNTIATLPNSIRLISNWFITTPYAPSWVGPYLSNPGVIVATSVLPALALGSILFLRGRADRVLYGAMVFTIFAATASNPPFGGVFRAATATPLLRTFYVAYLYSPVLLVFYSILGAVTVGQVTAILQRWEARPRTAPTSTSHGGARPTARRFSLSRPKPKVHLLFAPVCVGILIASAYPSLSPSFAAGSPGFPMSVTLPGYYTRASNYLADQNPNAPTMVFPEVSDFLPIEEGHTVWYNGPDPYPYLISNPSITSAQPPNYYGSATAPLSVPGFVYTIGGALCPPTTCTIGGHNLVPQTTLLQQNQSRTFVSSNSTFINWQASTPGDDLTFGGPSAAPSMTFEVDLSNSVETNHTLTGSLGAPENLEGYSYALIEYRLEGPSSGILTFGYESAAGVTELPVLGSNRVDLGNNVTLAVLPLQRGVPGEANLSSVTGFTFWYDPGKIVPGLANLTVYSLTFSPYSPALPSLWSTPNVGDEASLDVRENGTVATFLVNQSTSPLNRAHYLVGSFDAPVNFSGANFVAVTYTLSGVDPAHVSFGFKSAPDQGVGYALSNFLTVHHDDESTTLVQLSNPDVITGANSLSSVLAVYLEYQPLPNEHGTVSLELDSLAFLPGAPGDATDVLAHDLARLGVEFAYVDSGIQSSPTPAWTGDYFDELLTNSSAFEQVFKDGTVTIFRNLDYEGLFSAVSNISETPPVNATLGDQRFAYAGIYSNTSNFGVTYVDSSLTPTAPFGSANISGEQIVGPTQYRVTVDAVDSAVLVFRVNYNANWTATTDGGDRLQGPFVVDGYANGWLAPPGKYTVVISYSGQTTYGPVETITFFIPAVMIVWFVTFTALARRRSRAQVFAKPKIGSSE